MTTPLDYRSAGVDIEAADDAKRRIQALVESTRTAGAVGAFGSFGGLFRAPAGERPVLVASADGVGTKIKVVSGYRGGNEVFLAMERGEVHGRCGSMVASITSTRPDWFPEKKVTVPFQIALERDPDFPDAPALGEFAKDARTRQILELVVAHMHMDKPVLLPPGVPADRVAELWRIGGDKVPRPLGLLAPGAVTPALLKGARLPGADDILAISIEPRGGSPTGAPTGPVIATGALVDMT